MAGIVPAVLPLGVAPLLVPPLVVLGAVALPHAEGLCFVADNDEASILLQKVNLIASKSNTGSLHPSQKTLRIFFTERQNVVFIKCCQNYQRQMYG